MQLLIYLSILFSNLLNGAQSQEPPMIAEVRDPVEILYTELGLKGKVSFDAFRYAMEGMTKIENRRKPNILSVIDFTKPSTQKRMCVINLKERKVLYYTHVSHGRNSGDNYAVSFSNKPGSYQSSLGFYLTENTYIGRNGYSLILEGLEKGINDKARERAIVIHGAKYSDPAVISSSGRLGRSLGCPALPPDVAMGVIDKIKGGSLLYIYAADPTYIGMSELISVTPEDAILS